MPALQCLCCGKWRIEVINLDGHPTYKVTQSGLMFGRDGYVRTTQQVTELLRRLGGPGLDQFEECE